MATSQTEMMLHYLESEQGCVLVIETAGSVYGSMRAVDRVKFLTAQTVSQMGTRNLKVNPRIKDTTG